MEYTTELGSRPYGARIEETGKGTASAVPFLFFIVARMEQHIARQVGW